jgi:hypothetical protein
MFHMSDNPGRSESNHGRDVPSHLVAHPEVLGGLVNCQLRKGVGDSCTRCRVIAYPVDGAPIGSGQVGELTSSARPREFSSAGRRERSRGPGPSRSAGSAGVHVPDGHAVAPWLTHNGVPPPDRSGWLTRRQPHRRQQPVEVLFRAVRHE